MKKDPQQEVDEELQFHLEQRTRDYLARGMSPEAAREAASQRFGDTARVREACTSALVAGRAAERRRTFSRVSWLDVKLGLRMFAKYPGLSLVAVGGMAVAIAFGAGYFSLVGAFLDSSLPFEDGDRVVVIKNRHVSGPDAGPTGWIGQPGAARPVGRSDRSAEERVAWRLRCLLRFSQTVPRVWEFGSRLQSARSAETGSTRVARRTGARDPIAAAVTITRTAVTHTRGS